jgi:hypothetical protein
LKAAAGDTVNTIARRGILSSSDEWGRFGFVQNQELRTSEIRYEKRDGMMEFTL